MTAETILARVQSAAAELQAALNDYGPGLYVDVAPPHPDLSSDRDYQGYVVRVFTEPNPRQVWP